VKPWNIEGAADFKAAVLKGKQLKLAPVTLGHDDLAFLQYTGGTTGVAKGAMLTHGNLCANILQAEAWIGHYFQGRTGRVDHAHPAVSHLRADGELPAVRAPRLEERILIINPRDFPAVIAEMKKYPFAFITGVNTLFNALLHAPGFVRSISAH
jgi:long-chain acyl-CoA synthetase